MRRHSAGDASRLAALLLPQILPIFSVVAPCHPGASPPSMLRRIYEMSSSSHPCRTYIGTDVRCPWQPHREDSTETKVILDKHTHRVRVLIADDHQLIMEELVGLLREQVDVVGTVSDGRSLVEAAVRLQPDVVVTDISMPGMNGIESLRSLKASRVVTKVIFLTMYADSELASEALRGGAAGFVLKHSAGEELMTAIDEALQGRVYVSPEVAGRPKAPD
jgi:CheY-like chemotaxis protein